MKIFFLLSCSIFLACGNSNANIKTLESGDNVRGVNLKIIDRKMVSPEACSKVKVIAWGNKYNSKGYPIIGIPKSAGPFFRRNF